MPSEQQKAVLCLLCTIPVAPISKDPCVNKKDTDWKKKSLRQQYLLNSRPQSKLKDSFLFSVLHVCQSAPSSKKQ